jgi:MFS family permease
MFLFRFGSIIGVGVNWTFMPLYGHENLHLSGSKIGILVSMTVLMTTLLQPYFGRLADRVNRTWMTVVGGALASLCLLGIPYCQSFYHLLMLNTLMGAAIGAYMPPLMAMAVEVGRKTRMMTRIMSVLELSFSTGMVVGPLMAGLIEEFYGIKGIFRVGGAIGILTCAAFLMVTIKKGKE